MKQDPINVLLGFFVKHMPKTAYLVKNTERYAQAEKTAKALANIALECDEDAEIQIYPDDLTGTSLCLEITADIFNITKLDRFCELLKVANAFGSTALTDGRIQIGITFEDAWIPAPPRK